MVSWLIGHPATQLAFRMLFGAQTMPVNPAKQLGFITILTTNHGQPSQITGIFNAFFANARYGLTQWLSQFHTLKETEFGV